MSVVPHPLTLRERLYLTAQLRTLRGGALRDGDRMAIDHATQTVAGADLADDGTIMITRMIAPGVLGDLEVAVAVLERIVRQHRSSAADPANARWAPDALARDQRALQMLRRTRNAARRADRG